MYVCDVCERMVHLTDGTLYLLTDLDIRYKKIYMGRSIDRN